MTCRFNDLQFGEIVGLSGGTAICGICAGDVQSSIESTKWAYQGHSNELDLFIPVKKVFCPHCGKSITAYSEVCGDSGGLNVTATFSNLFEKVGR